MSNANQPIFQTGKIKRSMKQVTITFEITDEKTLVTAIGSNGSEQIDITLTDIENDLNSLLKKIRDFQQTKKIVDALDLNTWSTTP